MLARSASSLVVGSAPHTSRRRHLGPSALRPPPPTPNNVADIPYAHDPCSNYYSVINPTPRWLTESNPHTHPNNAGGNGLPATSNGRALLSRLAKGKSGEQEQQQQEAAGAYADSHLQQQQLKRAVDAL